MEAADIAAFIAAGASVAALATGLYTARQANTAAASLDRGAYRREVLGPAASELIEQVTAFLQQQHAPSLTYTDAQRHAFANRLHALDIRLQALASAELRLLARDTVMETVAADFLYMLSRGQPDLYGDEWRRGMQRADEMLQAFRKQLQRELNLGG